MLNWNQWKLCWWWIEQRDVGTQSQSEPPKKKSPRGTIHSFEYLLKGLRSNKTFVMNEEKKDEPQSESLILTSSQ